MDARTVVAGADWPRVDSPVWTRLCRAVTASGLTLLALAALVVWSRRLAGALVEPPGGGVLCGLALVLGVVAIAFRAIYFPVVCAAPRSKAVALWAAPSGVLLLWAAGLSWHETSAGGLAGLWGLLLVEEGWSWARWLPETERREDAKTAAAAHRPTVFAPAPSANAVADGSAVDSSLASEDACDDELEQAVSQRLVRRRQADGSETMEGWIRAELAAGQRHAAAHVAICPPFASVAECFAEPVDGPPSQVKVAQVLPYGVRFEIKLDAPAVEATGVTIEFAIHQRSCES
jgi:hypothetical protein